MSTIKAGKAVRSTVAHIVQRVPYAPASSQDMSWPTPGSE